MSKQLPGYVVELAMSDGSTVTARYDLSGGYSDACDVLGSFLHLGGKCFASERVSPFTGIGYVRLSRNGVPISHVNLDHVLFVTQPEAIRKARRQK